MLGDGDRERRPVAVEDHAPLGSQGHLAHALVDAPGDQGVVLQHLQVDEPVADGGEGDEQRHDEHDRTAAGVGGGEGGVDAPAARPADGPELGTGGAPAGPLAVRLAPGPVTVGPAPTGRRRPVRTGTGARPGPLTGAGQGAP